MSRLEAIAGVFAKALGLRIVNSILPRADRVIE